jgi:site-specific recombinase XerD
LGRPAEILRTDLASVGIPATTPSGVIDFHALRATYASHLVASGVSGKVCRTLARDSTLSLTIGVHA